DWNTLSRHGIQGRVSASSALSAIGALRSARDDCGEPRRETASWLELDRLAGRERVLEVQAARPRLDAERIRPGQRRRVGAAVGLPDDHPPELGRLPLEPEGQAEARIRDREPRLLEVADVDVVVAPPLRARDLA